MLDKEVSKLINLEEQSHRFGLNLIASENYPSKNVLDACSSIFSTKYAEGYPGARYYEGCEISDDIENLAIERAKNLFDCDHVNVQVHSGTQANMAVFLATMKQGDNILSMKLDQGGHLSHGSKVNFSGKIYDCNFYGVDRESELIDYDYVEKIALEKNPKIIICGASAYSRIIDFERFSIKARQAINSASPEVYLLRVRLCSDIRVPLTFPELIVKIDTVLDSSNTVAGANFSASFIECLIYEETTVAP